MHEAVLEDALGDDARAAADAHERHDLGLHVRGEAGVGPGGQVDAAQGAVHAGPQGVAVALDDHAHLAQLEDDGVEGVHRAVLQGQVALGDAGRHEVRAGLDAVRHDAVGRAVQALHALDAHHARAVAGDLRPAAVQELRQVLDLGLAGRVLQHRLALGQGGGHDEVLGAAHGREVELDVRALQAIAVADDVAALQLEDRAHLLQALQMHVHGPGADGAAAGQGHAGAAQAGQERPQAQDRGAHGADQVVGGLGLEVAGLEIDLPFRVFGRAAQKLQQLQGGADVAQVRHVGQAHLAVDEDGGQQDGQGGVLGAADGHGALEGGAAFYDEFVHYMSLRKRRGSTAVTVSFC